MKSRYPVLKLTRIEGNTYDVEYHEHATDPWVWQARIVREGPIFFTRAGGLTAPMIHALRTSIVCDEGIYYL